MTASSVFSLRPFALGQASYLIVKDSRATWRGPRGKELRPPAHSHMSKPPGKLLPLRVLQPRPTSCLEQ